MADLAAWAEETPEGPAALAENLSASARAELEWMEEEQESALAEARVRWVAFPA